MASNSSDKELEQQLLEAGNKLLNPPSSVDELLPLLDTKKILMEEISSNGDMKLKQILSEVGNFLLNPPSSVDDLLLLLNQVENCLAEVRQTPSKSMQDALSPTQKALVTDQLFRHSNIDVKVAVATCLTEMTRITAPDEPYEEDLMEEVFQLIVSSFENLHRKSSRSYAKRVRILEVVAAVKSCVMMLDLECDGLIIEMFQHFFKTIRCYLPEYVFGSMSAIMCLVLEESDDIAVELLSPVLASVRKGDMKVLPTARKLGEQVLERCAKKVKPYLIQAVKSLGTSFDDYSDIVGSICQETGTVEQNENDVHAGGENKASEISGGESVDDLKIVIMTGKLKSGSSKWKEIDDDNETSADSDEVQEMTNVKLQGSEVKCVKRPRSGNVIIEIHGGCASTKAKRLAIQGSPRAKTVIKIVL